MARVLMLLIPLSLPSLTTAGRLLRWSVPARAIAERDHQEVDGLNLSVDGEGADWVIESKGSIKKDNLNFTAKFLWLIVRHCLSPTAADNIVTWDRAVLMAVMIAGFEVDFTWLLLVVMHDRAFKVITTYPFPCIIFSLYRSTGMPIWHVDQFKTPQGTVDIGLIRD